jgi:hypothetical protein
MISSRCYSCDKLRIYVALLLICAQAAAFCQLSQTRLSSATSHNTQRPHALHNTRRPHALHMAAISPPTKPPVLKGYGGRDNTPYIREIYDDEKSLICDTWIRSAKLTTSDADQLAEVASICDSVRCWKAGTGGARKRRSALPSVRQSVSFY